MAKVKLNRTEDIGGLLKDYKNNYKYESRPYHKETPNFGHLLWINNRLESKIEEAINGGGSGLDLERYYIKVYGNKTPTENGTELETAYATAKTMNPAADNIISLLVHPGYYEVATQFVMDTPYINLISLTGNRDISLELTGGGSPILIDTDYTHVRGIYTNTPGDPFEISNDLPNIVIENCKGGYFSFGGAGSIKASGTFIDCEAVGNSFGFNGEASGTFIRCSSIGLGGGSFGYDEASGIFI